MGRVFKSADQDEISTWDTRIAIQLSVYEKWTVPK